MKRSTIAAIGLLMAFATCATRADTVTDWNLTAIEVLKGASVRLGSGPGLRTLAMVHVAMSDAINTVQDRYTRYVATAPTVSGASAEAAGRPRHGKSWSSSIPIKKR